MAGEYRYQIRVGGHLPGHWSEWFEGLAITYDGDGETILSGPLPDQAALFGLLGKVQALNLPLLALARMEVGAGGCRGGLQTAPTDSS